MPTKQNFELKVGFFMLVGLGLLFMILARIGGFRAFETGYHLRLRYGFVDGIEPGAPVHFRGVAVGDVKRVALLDDPETAGEEVELLTWLPERIRVTEDAEARIRTFGLMGEKYIEIRPGSPDARRLRDRDVLVGYEPLLVESLAQMGDEIAARLNAAIDGINRIVGDSEHREALKGTIQNSEAFTQDLRSVVSSLKVILSRIEEGEGTAGRLLTEDRIYRDLEALTADLRRHPWKLLGRGRKAPDDASKPGNRGVLFKR